MPVKKSASKPSTAGRRKLVDASLPAMPLQVEAPVATQAESSIAVGVLMICAVALLGVFGSSLMAGIAGMTASPYMVCTEQAEFSNDFRVFEFDNKFEQVFGNISELKYVSNFIAGSIRCVRGNDDKKYNESCYKMSDCKQAGQCPMVATASCDPQKGDKLCSVYEQFIATTSTSASTVNHGSAVWFQSGPTTKSILGTIRQTCSFGCSNGACNTSLTTPVCTDSDINSNTGQSDIFMSGTVTGMIGDVFKTATDACVDSKTLIEYSCGNGQIVESRVGCDNGCTNGACERYTTKVNVGDSIRADGQNDIYYYASDKKKHLYPNNAVYSTWYSGYSNVKIVSPKTLDSIPFIRANVKVRAVGHIVRFDDGNHYFFVTAPGMIKEFVNDLAIVKLFGTDWKSRVVDVPWFFKDDYKIQSGLIDIKSKYPDGSLLIEENSNYPYYYIQNGKKRAFNSSQAFYLNNLRMDWLIKVSSSTINAFPNGIEIQGEEAMFIKPIR